MVRTGQPGGSSARLVFRGSWVRAPPRATLSLWFLYNPLPSLDPDQMEQSDLSTYCLHTSSNKYVAKAKAAEDDIFSCVFSVNKVSF